MAAFTAASQLGYSPFAPSSSHAIDGYAGTGFTETANGNQPESAGLGAWSGPTAARPAAGAEPGEAVPGSSHDLDATYAGRGFTETANGNQPESAGLGAWSGPVGRVGVEAAGSFAGTTTDHSLGSTYIGQGYTPASTGWDELYAEQEGLEENQVDRHSEAGTLIPTKYFRRVVGRVFDQDGNPIEDAVYLFTSNNLPTVGDVQDGVYSIYLLRQVYNDFYLVTEANGNKPYRFARYELAALNEPIDTVTETADLYFNTETPKPVTMTDDIMVGLGI